MQILKFGKLNKTQVLILNDLKHSINRAPYILTYIHGSKPRYVYAAEKLVNDYPALFKLRKYQFIKRPTKSYWIYMLELVLPKIEVN